MTRFSDLVNVNINRDVITIQGVEFPVIFTFKSFPFVEEAYGKPYHMFEKDLHRMMKTGKVSIGKNEIRLMNALIYSMLRSGGTDCTLHELEGAISINDLPNIFEKVMAIFNNQNFQPSDFKKIKTEKKS